MPALIAMYINRPLITKLRPGTNILKSNRICIHLPILEVSRQHNPKKKNKFKSKGNMYNRIITLNKFNHFHRQ